MTNLLFSKFGSSPTAINFVKNTPDKKLLAKWQKFLEDQPIVTYKKGEVILFQGEAPQFGFVIKHGIVKTYNLNTDGDEQLVYFNTTLDIFPMAWIMAKASVSLYYYQAITNCELYRLSRQAYLDFIQKDKALLLHELERYVSKDVNKTMRLNALLYSKAGDKILNTLHYLIHSHGINLKGDLVKINITLTHQDLANLTGLRRETVAVEMNKLKKDGLIYYRRRALYHINLAMIKKRLADQFILDSKLNP